MSSPTDRRNSDGYSQRAVAVALESAQRQRKRADVGGSDGPYPPSITTISSRYSSVLGRTTGI
jgi:hypothetical protein